MSITRRKSATQYELDKGVQFQDMAVKGMGTVGLSVGLAPFAPGALLPCPIHNCKESITIPEGAAYCYDEGKRYRLVPYDTSHVPAGARRKQQRGNEENR